MDLEVTITKAIEVDSDSWEATTRETIEAAIIREGLVRTVEGKEGIRDEATMIGTELQPKDNLAKEIFSKY